VTCSVLARPTPFGLLMCHLIIWSKSLPFGHFSNYLRHLTRKAYRVEYTELNIGYCTQADFLAVVET